MAGFAENVEPFQYTLDAVKRTLFEARPVGRIEPNRGGWTDEFLDWSDPELASRRRRPQPSTGPRTLQGRGTVRGPLIGGCAEVLEMLKGMLKGTPWWPPLEAWHGAILFYETSEEAPKPSQLVRWLRNFAAQGILEMLSACFAAAIAAFCVRDRIADDRTTQRHVQSGKSLAEQFLTFERGRRGARVGSLHRKSPGNDFVR